ncbi:N-carbamoylputrescine amidase [Ensifer sp.]|jgi:N-carbamoylputrescine amidase|uniref:N-carbamoylputrescine amidase n=1 Tax=Ensifer sp. TaxID=1872086 RepID=UPI002E147668|nr:N-carbamoylputrescine amidase [Ensifer sp.]
MSEITVAATQMACSWNIDENIEKAEELVRLAHEDGAQIILLQELFQTPYFCLEQTIDHLDLAASLGEDRAVRHFRTIAKELGVVLPISYYEKAGPAQYNSLAIIDADGEIVWNYRKSHIPQAPGYEEKFYFSPGDTGFRAVDTKYARIGCGICWDQWFPETARALALQGAELLFFPTAIGSEQMAEIDSSGHWRRTMQGHAAANMVPVIASNRVGSEAAGGNEALFYGTSFIADHTGAIVAEASRTDETYLTARFDLNAVRTFRRSWGIYRDRRPDLYGAIRTLDGQTPIG